MSEPKLISPMLDDFMMGSPMSSRQGITCCPAMPKNSDKKYIVKIISIPASQVQLEALLLTGAFHTPEQALAYFKDQADRLVDEIGVLKKLSTLEGFLPFENHQLVVKENEPGYELYMLSSYKQSLDRLFQRHNMTHLNAVNLGLDMCASLAVCRRAGYLYVDLKPENIFISDDGEFRIGDLGFLPMGSMRYISLDERYYSPYTAPEARDLFTTINDTLDTYAAGMILYQTYNDGMLPSHTQGEPIMPPQYADYEMAAIIMKAIDPDPSKRWKDPIAMGQAIVTYMQKYGANDVPIVPVVQKAAAVVAAAAEAPVAAVVTATVEDPVAAIPTEQVFADAPVQNLPQTQASAEGMDQVEIPEFSVAEAQAPLDPVSEQLAAAMQAAGQEKFPPVEAILIPGSDDAPVQPELPDASPTDLDEDEIDYTQISLAELDSMLGLSALGLGSLEEMAAQEADVSPSVGEDGSALMEAPDFMESVGLMEAPDLEATAGGMAAENFTPAEQAPVAPSIAEEAAEEIPALEGSAMEAASLEETAIEETASEEAASEKAALVAPVENDPGENQDALLSSGLDEEDAASLAFLEDLVADETAPSEDLAPEVDYQEISQETSDILAQADELLSHETPAGVVAPEPIDVPMPAPIVLKQEEPTPEPELPAVDADFQPPPIKPSSEYYQEEMVTEDEDYYEDAPKRSGSKKWLIALLIGLIIAGLCFGGYYYYNEYYLQRISRLDVIGKDNTISVQVVTDADQELLNVVCIDTHGTKRTSPVVNGLATFDDLNPGILYNVYVEIEGFHKLVGPNKASYTTPKPTNIISFTAVTGAEDGSVTLRFKADGQTTPNWKVVFSTPGEEERSQSFTDNMVTITGLTVGKTYTFTLQAEDNSLYIVGNKTLEYTAMALVKAQEVHITSCANGKLNVKWQAPENYSVSNWIVRCYTTDDTSYDQTITTGELSAEFINLDSAKAYTVDVTAEGMTSPSRAFVTANSVTIVNPKVNTTDPKKILVSWDYAGAKPQGELLVLYSMDGFPQTVVHTSTNSAVIPDMVPNSNYSFVIETQSGVDIFDNQFAIKTPAAAEFNSYGVTKQNFKFTMCETPNKEDWQHSDIQNITNTFKKGQKASFKLVVSITPNNSADTITTMYVIRDAQGNLISKDTQARAWTDMWLQRRCELDIPALPQEAGEYTIEVYFNGSLAHQQSFAIKE